MAVKGLKGFKDILPDETHNWQRVEAIARDVFRRFGFAEIRVPILEKTALFVRSIGEATDIVEKEMYTFLDRNGSSLTMRPEGTASVLRAFVEHGMHVSQPVQRLYTIGPMFRHERPQKGRLRQFHQMSVEVVGAGSALVDAEVMAMAWQLLREVGVHVRLEINSLGCPGCRPAFKETLVAFLDERRDKLCADCERRLQTNPLRVLDCKSSNCREHFDQAPSILENLCGNCEGHFQAVRQGLHLLDIPFKVNSFMVRGLDYYTRTAFELVTDELGAQSAVAAGGRYDGLVSQLGGPRLPGIGFAVGMERLLLLLGLQGGPSEPPPVDLFLVTLGENATVRGFQLAYGLRARGLQVIMDHEGHSLKNQMKQAGRLKAGFVLILGEDELVSGQGILRNMESGEQEALDLPEDSVAWCEIVAGKLGKA